MKDTADYESKLERIFERYEKKLNVVNILKQIKNQNVPFNLKTIKYLNSKYPELLNLPFFVIEFLTI